MDCPECGTETIDFPVPEELARYLPGDDSGATLCPHCLTVQPLADAPSSTPPFDDVPTAFPDGEARPPCRWRSCSRSSPHWRPIAGN